MRGALKGLLRYHRLRAITAAMTLIALDLKPSNIIRADAALDPMQYGALSIAAWTHVAKLCRVRSALEKSTPSQPRHL
jgi:hypothetical protein